MKLNALTFAKFNWITSIRDPKDALHELPQYMLAHYRAAALGASMQLKIEKEEITEIQVHDYMLRRAVEILMVIANLLGKSSIYGMA